VKIILMTDLGRPRALATFIGLMAWVLMCGAVDAQTLLRWKLKPGESFSVRTQQQTESEVGFSGKSAKTKLENELHLTWTVISADEQSITLRQTVDRIVVNMLTRDAAAAQFDSAVSGRPTGQGASLASGLKPLVGAEFEIKMSVLGKIAAVNPINEAARALFGKETKAPENESAGRETMQQLLKQPLVVLSEKEVSGGDSWQETIELDTAAGPLRQVTTYKLEVISEQNGEQVCRVSATSTMDPKSETDKAAEAMLKIVNQNQSSVILFSASEGRVLEIEQAQKLETLRAYRETNIVVKLNCVQKTKVERKR
jgi:hypothetical protein